MLEKFVHEGRTYVTDGGAAFYLDAGHLMCCPRNMDGTPDTFIGMQMHIDDMTDTDGIDIDAVKEALNGS